MGKHLHFTDEKRHCLQSPSSRHIVANPKGKRIGTCELCGRSVKRAHLRSTMWYAIARRSPNPGMVVQSAIIEQDGRQIGELGAGTLTHVPGVIHNDGFTTDVPVQTEIDPTKTGYQFVEQTLTNDDLIVGDVDSLKKRFLSTEAHDGDSNVGSDLEDVPSVGFSDESRAGDDEDDGN
jgi:hypothetical protein